MYDDHPPSYVSYLMTRLIPRMLLGFMLLMAFARLAETAQGYTPEAALGEIPQAATAASVPTVQTSSVPPAQSIPANPSIDVVSDADERLITDRVGSAFWSPDLMSVLYVTSEANRMLGIYITDTQRGIAHFYGVREGYQIENAVWSLSSRYVAFRVLDGEYASLYVVDTIDHEMRLLYSFTSTIDVLSTYTWSPNSQFLAYTMSQVGNYDIYLFDTSNNRSSPTAAHSASDTHPVWSPDSHYLYFTTDRNGDVEIFAVEMYTRTALQITDFAAGEREPSVSPDATKIVYVQQQGTNAEIFILDLRSQSRRNITHHGADDVHPVWFGGGTTILFHSDREYAGTLRTFTMEADGSNVRSYIPPPPPQMMDGGCGG